MLAGTGVVLLVVTLVTVVYGTSLLTRGVIVVLTVVSSVLVDVIADVISSVLVATSSVVLGVTPSVGNVV